MAEVGGQRGVAREAQAQRDPVWPVCSEGPVLRTGLLPALTGTCPPGESLRGGRGHVGAAAALAGHHQA